MIAAVLLAAGESRRMGQPKLTLPWGEVGSVIEHVFGLFHQAGADPIVVVTGGARGEIERALHGRSVEFVHNPDHREGGMLSSIHVGLHYLHSMAVAAALLTPADLPTLTATTIQAVLDRREQSGGELIVPSYRMRRGHPVLLGRSLWQAVLDLQAGQSLREFLRAQARRIDYVEVQDPGVIEDLDTPEEYLRSGPGGPITDQH